MGNAQVFSVHLIHKLKEAVETVLVLKVLPNVTIAVKFFAKRFVGLNFLNLVGSTQEAEFGLSQDERVDLHIFVGLLLGRILDCDLTVECFLELCSEIWVGANANSCKLLHVLIAGAKTVVVLSDFKDQLLGQELLGFLNLIYAQILLSSLFFETLKLDFFANLVQVVNIVL
jgi:hypothetical protein